jgi:hypothetical protein
MPAFRTHENPACGNCGQINGKLSRVGDESLCFECASRLKATKAAVKWVKTVRIESRQHAPEFCDGCNRSYEFVTVTKITLIDHKACKTFDRSYCPACLADFKASDRSSAKRQEAARRIGFEQVEGKGRGRWDLIDTFKGHPGSPRSDPRAQVLGIGKNGKAKYA